MKITFLIITGIFFFASSLALAGATKLTCKTIGTDPDDMLRFESMDVSIDSKNVTMTNVRLTDKFTAELEKGVKSGEDSKDPKDKKYAKMLRAFLSVASSRSGLTIVGKSKPYVKPPKTPRTRYPFKFESETYDSDAIIGELGYETDSAMLMVYINDGKPNYEKISFEYDGSQGPYYDHFSCN